MPLQVAGVSTPRTALRLLFSAKKKDKTSAWFKGLNAAEGGGIQVCSGRTGELERSVRLHLGG